MCAPSSKARQAAQTCTGRPEAGFDAAVGACLAKRARRAAAPSLVLGLTPD